MKTIKLEISNKFYDKVLGLLHKPEDVKVIDENNSVKRYLSKELEDIDNGTAEFISLEELDKVMEERISKYEINTLESFLYKLTDQVECIAEDKPFAARKFKKDVLNLLK